MQFHLNGFRPGDPSLTPHPDATPDDIDVLIAGAGPASLRLAADMLQFP